MPPEVVMERLVELVVAGRQGGALLEEPFRPTRAIRTTAHEGFAPLGWVVRETSPSSSTGGSTTSSSPSTTA
jgi:hypothetical protein